jgi:hypothetical protein
MSGASPYESALLDARERVESLAAPDGAFAVACTDTGVRPPPVSDARFETYEEAERARDAAVTYREALRDLDPGLPEHDLGVCEPTDTTVGFASVRETTTERRENGLPQSKRTVTLTGEGRDEWLRVENAPVVHLTGPEELLDDEVVERQLRATFDPR